MSFIKRHQVTKKIATTCGDRAATGRASCVGKARVTAEVKLVEAHNGQVTEVTNSAQLHTCSALLDRKKSRHANNLEVDQLAAGFQGGLQFRRIVASVVEHAYCVH